MRLLFSLAFAITLFACDTPATTATETVNPAPDRAALAREANMALSPAAIKPNVVFAYEDVLWSFRFLPDSRIIATDRAGKLLLISADGSESKEITGGVPEVRAKGQGGLMEVLLDPDFVTNRTIYLSYSKPDGKDNAGTAVGRATLNIAETALENFTVLYEIEPKTDVTRHYGGKMIWGPQDGHLYFTVGDRGNRDENPQDSTRDAGKVYRIAKDGSIPADNPFIKYPAAKQAIYSYGHRNPQSLTAHPETGEIWETEHGPRGGDEINIIQPGLNYGWPVITYGINYDGSQITEEVARPGMEQPLHYWVPSIAPSGMCFITGDKYPGWEGDLLVGSLKFMRVQHVRLDGKDVVGEDKLLNNLGRVRDLRMGPDGYAYASVEGEGIVRLAVE
ncbi:PQQ-dependent sugar dehydrogenase [Neolewinella antarctica]|uniref:Glucose/arabinose dehydrogenase n=1 Tax=Neolewinella antarctica TaxID=442734 RepID=A0ABX0X8Z2_9BACT|nr:PQQ-dependent sugar dehydrogenase [Neolewinella antarctica]NJC25733.1 glucose/arabinose dehydrogenase [Neolewinella antarctica]